MRAVDFDMGGIASGHTGDWIDAIGVILLTLWRLGLDLMSSIGVLIT